MSLIKCSECSAEISDKASRCPKCGAPVVVHEWRCSKCGNMISEEPCPHCSKAQTAVNTNTVGCANSVGTTPAFVAKKKSDLGVLITFLVVVAIGIVIVIAVSTLGNGGSTESKKSHSNCMFIGYADPNRPLNGKSHCTTKPQYGYRPVYVDRDDIYNTYHFH